MSKTRKRETTVELHEVVIVRTRPSASEPCADCLPAASLLVSPEIAAAVTGTSVRAVFRFIEAGAVHYREGDEGQIGVCINSLALCVKATNGEFTTVRKEIKNEAPRELTPLLK